jgi:hypothetical protein
MFEAPADEQAERSDVLAPAERARDTNARASRLVRDLMSYATALLVAFQEGTRLVPARLKKHNPRGLLKEARQRPTPSKGEPMMTPDRFGMPTVPRVCIISLDAITDENPGSPP